MIEEIKEKKKTVGEQAAPLLSKEPESRDPIEIQREMQKEYIDNLIMCVETHKKIFPSHFFVTVLTKREKLLPNVFRNYFLANLACPTPNYDQAVFRYNKDYEHIEYIWTIPDRETCYYFLNNKHLIVKEEQQLLKHIIDFADGILYKKAKEFNGEE